MRAFSEDKKTITTGVSSGSSCVTGTNGEEGSQTRTGINQWSQQNKQKRKSYIEE